MPVVHHSRGRLRSKLLSADFRTGDDHRSARPHDDQQLRTATIPRIPELDTPLEELKDRPRAAGVGTVLVNSFGRPWPGDGIGGSFNRVCDLAGITYLDPEPGAHRRKHLHDLRGTFCTRLILAGPTDQEAGDIMGQSRDQVARIRRTYVDQTRVIVAIGERIAAKQIAKQSGGGSGN